MKPRRKLRARKWRMKFCFSRLGLIKPRFMAIRRIEILVEPSEKGATTSMANQTIRCAHELISYLMRLNKEILNMNV